MFESTAPILYNNSVNNNGVYYVMYFFITSKYVHRYCLTVSRLDKVRRQIRMFWKKRSLFGCHQTMFGPAVYNITWTHILLEDYEGSGHEFMSPEAT